MIPDFEPPCYDMYPEVCKLVEETQQLTDDFCEIGICEKTCKKCA